LHDLDFVKAQILTFERYGLHDFSDFFDQRREEFLRELFFPGIFAYHWHNMFDSQLQRNSVAGGFYQHFEQLKANGRYLS
jgi:hypothetical protein